MAIRISSKTLTREDIQRYVGFTNLQRGETYASNKAICQAKLKDYVLTAFCQGHEFDPYRVEAIFDENGIYQSYCSCPVGADGKCKHVAALLLTWLDCPDQFADWQALKDLLAGYDASTLVELIDLLEDKTDLSTEIIQAFQQNLSAIHSASLAKSFRRIEEAFQAARLPWYHPEESGMTEICFALAKIRSDAHHLVQEGKTEKAIKIYQALIHQILNYLDGHKDPWSNLTEELKGCIQGLSHALEASLTAEERLKVFQILFSLIEEKYYRNEDIGSEEAKQVILQKAQGVERDRILA